MGNTTAPSTSSQTPRHINWREVIELTPEILARIEPVYQKELLTALDTIERDAYGQQKLALLYEHQQALPADHQWKTPLADAVADPETIAIVMAANEDRAKRDPRRVYLDLARPGGSAVELHDRSNNLLYREHNDDHYKAGLHSVKLLFPPIKERKVVKLQRNGEKQLVPMHTDEAIIHELQHAIDALEIRLKLVPSMSRSCREANADLAQSTYVTRRDPNAPRRENYEDAEFHLKKLMTTLYPTRTPWFDRLRKAHIPASISGQLVYPSEPQAIEKATTYTAPLLLLDAGCLHIDEDELLQRTRALLQSNGLNSQGISDEKMRQWIDKGMKRHGIQYE